MKHFNRILLLSLVTLLLNSLNNCSSDMGGGTTSTENGKVLGVVKNEADSFVSGCEVLLISSDYNPLTGNLGNLRKDTTNILGEYLFDSVKKGDYNLFCRDSNFSILVDFNVYNNTVILDDQILMPVSSLTLKLSDNLSEIDYAYFEGTPFYQTVDAANGTIIFENLPYGLMPDLILGDSESNSAPVIKSDIVLSSGGYQELDIDTVSFIVTNREVGVSSNVLSVGASPFRLWGGLTEGLYFSIGGNNWTKTDTGASPWIKDSILKIEGNECLNKDWALIKTKSGTLFYHEGTYWSVEEQLIPQFDGELPLSMHISDKGELIFSYLEKLAVGVLIEDTIIDFKWSNFQSGSYEYITGHSDTLYLVKDDTQIYRRFGTEQPYLFYTLPRHITDIELFGDQLFIGYDNGLAKYDLAIDSLSTLYYGDSYSKVRSIVKDTNGIVWAIEKNHTLLSYDGNTVETYTPEIDSIIIFNDMVLKGKNELWISAGKDGIFTIKPVY